MQRTTHQPRCVAADHARIGSAWKAAPFLFGSGFCALVYQVAWQREFRLIFGASTAASAAVVAIFMGSLGAGGWVLGRMADHRADPWRLYARLEALVALTAALTPPLLWAARALYIGLGGSIVLGSFAGTLLRPVLASLVLLPPMFLAGGDAAGGPKTSRVVGRISRRGSFPRSSSLSRSTFSMSIAWAPAAGGEGPTARHPLPPVSGPH